MFARFEIIPAVDIESGEVVQLVGGQRGSGTRYGDPLEAAKSWVDAGATTLHLVDLDGAFEGERRNAEAIEQIVQGVDIDLQLGGGIRTTAEAIALLDKGIDRVIFGTAAIAEPTIVAEVAEKYPEGVMVSLDASEGEVRVAGWTEGTGIDPVDAATRYEELGAGAILFTDIDVEGRLEGVRVRRVERLVEAVSIPVVASGGVASIDDILALHDAGAAAVVIGTALYEGRFTLHEAQMAVTS